MKYRYSLKDVGVGYFVLMSGISGVEITNGTRSFGETVKAFRALGF